MRQPPMTSMNQASMRASVTRFFAEEDPSTYGLSVSRVPNW
jgi:hypothetical protein